MIIDNAYQKFLLFQNYGKVETTSEEGRGSLRFLLCTLTSICDDILSTALDIVLSLPPLSLANESKLTKLGTKTLDQTTTFLKTVFSANSGADHHGRMLASQVMLSLAAQRGSLKCLLEWVELAIMTSSRGGDTQVDGGLSDNKVTWQLFKDVVTEMMKAAVSMI